MNTHSAEWAYRFEGRATAALITGEQVKLLDECAKLLETVEGIQAVRSVEVGQLGYGYSVQLGFALNNALAALAEFSARYEEATRADESDAKEAAYQDYLLEVDLEETARLLGPLGGGR